MDPKSSSQPTHQNHQQQQQQQCDRQQFHPASTSMPHQHRQQWGGHPGPVYQPAHAVSPYEMYDVLPQPMPHLQGSTAGHNHRYVPQQRGYHAVHHHNVHHHGSVQTPPAGATSPLVAMLPLPMSHGEQDVSNLPHCPIDSGIGKSLHTPLLPPTALPHLDDASFSSSDNNPATTGSRSASLEHDVLGLTRRHRDEELRDVLNAHPSFEALATQYASDADAVIVNCAEQRGNIVAALLASNRLTDQQRVAILHFVASHARKFVATQPGSLAIRAVLREALPEERHTLAMALQPSIPTLLTDEFGNYVVQYLLEECGEEVQWMVFPWVLGNIQEPATFVSVARTRGGSKILELIIHSSATAQFDQLVATMRVGNAAAHVAGHRIGRFVARAIANRLRAAGDPAGIVAELRLRAIQGGASESSVRRSFGKA